MDDGFYTMTFVGVAGMGLGTLLLENGRVRGFDMQMGEYNGTYVRHPDGAVDFTATLLVAAGKEIVTGMAPPDKTVLVPLGARVPANWTEDTIVMVKVGDREAQVSFTYMRGV
jgi:hypothetical protein